MLSSFIRKHWCGCLFTLGLAGLTLPSMAAPVVKNNSFEVDKYLDDAHKWPGYGVVTDWTKAGGNFGINDPTGPFLSGALTPDGAQAAILQGGNSSFFQDVDGFEAGKKYILTYFEIGRTGDAGPKCKVQINGVDVVADHSQVIATSGGPMDFQAAQFDSPGAGTFKLEFFNTSDPAKDNTINIDNVNIIEVGSAASVYAPGSVNFPMTTVGANISKTFVIDNTGGSALNVSSLQLAGTDAGAFNVTSPTGNFSVAAGQKQEVTVKFTPTKDGDHTSTLTINSNAANGAAYKVGLLGKGAVPVEKIALDPIGYGNDVYITGIKGPKGGFVEAYVNGTQQGSSAKVNPDGTFMIGHLNLRPGDKVVVAASRTWNFNTDGDVEGWAFNNLTPTVQGGILKLELSGDDPFMTNSADGVPGNVYQVIEIRQKNNTPHTSMQLFFVNPVHNITEGTSNNSLIDNKTGQFNTFVWPVAWKYNNTGANPSDWTSDKINNIRLDWYGAPNGSTGTIEVDYIRMTEYIEYNFNYDGDQEYWGTFSGHVNNISNLNVANGCLNFKVTGGDPWVGMGGGDAGYAITPFIDASYFNTCDMDATITAASKNNLFGFFWQDKWRDASNDGWGVNGNNLQNTLPNVDGQPFNLSFDMTAPDKTPGTWKAADNPVFWNAFRMDLPEGGTDGDNVSIDTLRFRPRNSYGPAIASVTDKMGRVTPTVGWPIQCVKTSKAPTLDGVISADEWTPAGDIKVELNAANLSAYDKYLHNYIHNGGRYTNSANQITSDADLSGTLYFLYDNTAIYLAADVKDDELLPGTGATLNGGDCYQPCLDFDQLQAADSQVSGAKVYIPSFAARTNSGTAPASNDNANMHQFWPSDSPNPMTGMTWNAKTNATGYVIEIKIPWSALTAGGEAFTKAMPPTEGQTMGILPLLDDHDTVNGAAAPSFMETEGGDGNFLVAQPAKYSVMTFTGEPATGVNSARDWEVFE